MTALNIFIPIRKIDAKQRLVYGIATAEVADKSNEIFDYESSKPYYEKWSAEMEKNSDGKSKGNLRAMHGNVAAGKLTQLEFNDAAKQIEICAKVVDDAEWAKVEEGVYTGFSQGGAYVKKWNDPDTPTLKRYTANPAEISLVDNPCVPTATFEYIKADGSRELRKFNHQEIEMTKKTAPAAEKDQSPEAEAVTQAADSPLKAIQYDKNTGITDDAADKVEKSERPQDKGGVIQGFLVPGDESFHLKKADALNRVQELEAQTVAQPAMEALKKLADAVTKAESGTKKENDATDAGTNAVKPAEAVVEKSADQVGDAVADKTDNPANVAKTEAAKAEADKAAPAWDMKKGMYGVSNFAELLQSILCIQQDAQWEAEWEGDNSELPGKLKTWLADGGALLVQMVGEETAELTASKVASGDLAKKGAAISAATKGHIEKMMRSASDHMDQMGKCYKDLGMGETAEKLDKGDLEKTAAVPDGQVAAENLALKKVLNDMTPTIDALVKRVEQLESQPMPSKGVLRVVEKTTDGQGNVSDGDAVTKAQELLKGMSPEEVNTVLMKSALSKPIIQIRK